MELAQRIEQELKQEGAALVGFADLNGLVPERLGEWPRGVSFALPMEPEVMAGLSQGPTREYTALYQAKNLRINALAAATRDTIEATGFKAWPVPASVRSDPQNIRGDFPHKTAATRSGLGWIGRHCQLVTRELGPWLRLGTVFTDAPLPLGRPVERSHCGACHECVAACPAGALKDGTWSPGVEREAILDPRVCDVYKKTHFLEFSDGHICGICTSACPFGQKLLRR